MNKLIFVLLFIMTGDVFAALRQVENIQEFTYDFSTSGGTSNTNINFTTAVSGSHQLPLNVVVKEVLIKVVTPFTTSGSATATNITIGNSISSAGYLTASQLSSFTDNAIFIGNGGNATGSYYVSGSTDRNIVLKVTSGSPITAGRLRAAIKYYLFGED